MVYSNWYCTSAFFCLRLPLFSACAVLLYADLIVCIPFLFGVRGRMWNSIVSVPDHCLFVHVSYHYSSFSFANFCCCFLCVFFY